MLEEKIKLFSVTHKAEIILPAGRVLIAVGNNNIPNADYADNTGENIAEKNGTFCELTALYWIWKNFNAEYIGFEHYRRFFCQKSLFKASVLSKEKILKIIDKYDIILPKQLKAEPNVYEYYAKEHYKEDLDICIEIIKRDYPDYCEDLTAVMKSDRMNLFNMFVMPKNLMDEYCEWLFDILFKAEKQIDISGRDAYQSRVFGFLSERLFNVWLAHKKLKCYYAPVYNIGDRPFIFKFKGLLRRIKRLFTNNNEKKDK